MALSRLIGSRLRARRMALGLKQAQVAEAAGVSASFLNLIEHNRRRVGPETLVRLAGALGTDATALTEADEGAIAEELRLMAAGTGAEMERLGELVSRFPGWAAAMAETNRRAAQAERAVAVLNDRLTHDPYLSQSLHDLLSALSGVRATAAILAETEDLEADWRQRFQRNLHQDAERLAAGAEGLVAYLDRSGGEPSGMMASPQEELDAWLAAQGWHLAAAEQPEGGRLAAALAGLQSAEARDLGERMLEQAAADAALMPLVAFQAAVGQVGADPLRLAALFGASPIAGFRRLALLPGSDLGLVICDAAGALSLRKPARGFAVPRIGAACALWPLFQALHRPMQPVATVAALAGRMGTGHFRLRAFAEPERAVDFQASVRVTAAMLIEPVTAQAGAQAQAMGSQCRICGVTGCAARREASILPVV